MKIIKSILTHLNKNIIKFNKTDFTNELVFLTCHIKSSVASLSPHVRRDSVKFLSVLLETCDNDYFSFCDAKKIDLNELFPFVILLLAEKISFATLNLCSWSKLKKSKISKKKDENEKETKGNDINIFTNKILFVTNLFLKKMTKSLKSLSLKTIGY